MIQSCRGGFNQIKCFCLSCCFPLLDVFQSNALGALFQVGSICNCGCNRGTWFTPFRCLPSRNLGFSCELGALCCDVSIFSDGCPHLVYFNSFFMDANDMCVSNWWFVCNHRRCFNQGACLQPCRMFRSVALFAIAISVSTTGFVCTYLHRRGSVTGEKLRSFTESNFHEVVQVF